MTEPSPKSARPEFHFDKRQKLCQELPALGAGMCAGLSLKVLWLERCWKMMDIAANIPFTKRVIGICGHDELMPSNIYDREMSDHWEAVELISD